MRRRDVVAFLLALLALGLALAACTRAVKSFEDQLAADPSRSLPAHVALDTTLVRVVDGDTLVAAVEGHDERVRLIGIDTPETVSPSKPVQCYGKQASDHLKGLLPKGTPIRLVTDADTHDVYGRLLAYVYRRADGLFVNLELARDGFASLLTYPPNVAHQPQFSAAVDGAHRRRLGLWGTCGGPGVPLADPPTTSLRDGGPGR
jgi:micrococcal nuclease